MRGSTSTRAGRVGAFFACAALLAAGCGTRQTPVPAASPPSASPTAPATAVPAAHADTLRIGYPSSWFPSERQAAHAIVGYGTDFGFMVHAALYRLDARFDVVPDLADGPCEPREDGVVIRCRLVEATFHDGTPVTADDVAYTYGIHVRPAFPNPAEALRKLLEVRIVDPLTVDFVLTAVDPTFATTALPTVSILPRHAIEASNARFVAGTEGLEAGELTKLADAIDEEVSRDPPVCSPRVEDVEALVARMGVTLYREDFSRAETGVFDPCSYLEAARGFIRQAGVAAGLTGLDAVAAAWQLLSIDWRPIGAGPYLLLAEGPDRFRLEAWADYHGGPVATRFLDYVPANPDGSSFKDGTVDVLVAPELGTGARTAAASSGLRIATTASLGFMALHFNVRPDQLFGERDLRRALQLCVDLVRDVDSATGGVATPVYGPVVPGSWADEPDLPRPARDVAAARALIEGAGWRLGADGVYAKDGVRLAASIVTRGDRQQRVKMADLIAVQARDCGMDLDTEPATWDDILGGFLQYPHLAPGTDKPFDVYLGGWSTTPDPGTFDFLVSSQVTDAEHPDLNNIMGFSDPVVDRLVAAAMTTYDQVDRARLYREAQREVAAQVPMIFLWANDTYDILRPALATADGRLDLDVPNWAWQPERLVVAASP